MDEGYVMALLDKYRDEIIDLYDEQHFTLRQIRQRLEERHSVEIPLSTLISYVRHLREPSASPRELTPEENEEIERFLASLEETN